MTNNPTGLEEAAREGAKHFSPDSMEKMRAVALAGAGFCAALLLFILQDEELRRLVRAALFFAAVGMPLLLAAGFMVENYMLFGEAAYKSPRPAPFITMFAVFLIGSVCLFGAFLLVIFQFFPVIAFCFLAASIVALILIVWHTKAADPTKQP